jgi:hypothetical protein
LFPEDFENQIFDEDKIFAILKAYLSKYRQDTMLEMFLANFFVTFGILCSLKDVKNMIRELESKTMVKIIREPANTKTGKKSTFMESDNSKTVLIRSLI